MAGACKTVLKGAHKQAIRDLSILGSDSFMTASNDGDVKEWRLQMPEVSATPVRTIRVHDHFVYSMALLGMGDGEVSFAAAGESSGVKVFRGGREAQTLPVPAISVWGVAALSNGDLAAACSDGKVWIFTPHANRKAGDDLLVVLKQFQSTISHLGKLVEHEYLNF